MRSILILPSVLVGFCATFARATYYIDDVNNTLQYLPNLGAGMTWHVSSSPEIEVNKSYDGTTTIGECNASQNCQLKIPFTGSGIQLYVVQVNFAAINVSISIDDSSAATIHTMAEPQYYVHNQSIYEAQNLPSGDHTVNVNLLNYQYAGDELFAYTNGTSAFAFDYAVVNEDFVAASTGTSSSHSKSSPAGAIAGGVVGGVVVVAAAALLALFLIRRRRGGGPREIGRHEIDPEYRPEHAFDNRQMVSLPHPADDVQSLATLPWASSTFAPNRGYEAVNQSSPPPEAYDRSFESRQSSHMVPSAPNEVAYIPRDSQFSSGSSTAAPWATHSNPERYSKASEAGESQGRSVSPTNSALQAQLNANQLDFVHNLYRLNVPAPEIAAVMERMRAENNGELPVGMLGSAMSLDRTYTLPRYEAGPGRDEPEQS